MNLTILGSQYNMYIGSSPFCVLATESVCEFGFATGDIISGSIGHISLSDFLGVMELEEYVSSSVVSFLSALLFRGICSSSGWV